MALNTLDALHDRLVSLREADRADTSGPGAAAAPGPGPKSAPQPAASDPPRFGRGIAAAPAAPAPGDAARLPPLVLDRPAPSEEAHFLDDSAPRFDVGG